MEEIRLDSWADFLRRASESDGEQKSPLYRGVCNHQWGLDTSLERIGRKDETLMRYYRSIQVAKRYLECCLEKRQDIPEDLDEKYTNPETVFTGI